MERKGSGDASQTTQTVKGNATELIHERCEDMRYRDSHHCFAYRCGAPAYSMLATDMTWCPYPHNQPVLPTSTSSPSVLSHGIMCKPCGICCLFLLMQGSQSWRSRLKAQRSARTACSPFRRGPSWEAEQCFLSCCSTSQGGCTLSGACLGSRTLTCC